MFSEELATLSFCQPPQPFVFVTKYALYATVPSFLDSDPFHDNKEGIGRSFLDRN